MASHCNTYTIHQAISFPRGFNTYPQTQHNNVPRNSRKIEKRVQKEDPLGNKLWKSDGTPQWTSISVDQPVHNANVTYTQTPQSEPPIPNPLPQGLNPGGGRGGSRGGRGRGGLSRGRNNGSNGGQSGQTGQAGQNNHQGTATGATNATGGATGTIPKEKCTLCNGAHSNLMFCSKLSQYLPYGTNQLPPPVSLCLKCLTTKHKNAKNCDHWGNKYWKSQLCSTTNKHSLMCTGCSHHLPAIKYLKDHHKPSIGYKNFTLMKQCFGDDMFKAMISTCNACKGLCCP